MTLLDTTHDALDMEQRYREADSRARQFRELVELGNALTVVPGLPDALDHGLERALAFSGAATGAIYLLDERGDVELKAGEADAAASNLIRLAEQAIATRAVVREEDTDEDADGARGALRLALPLTPSDGVPVGAITLVLEDGLRMWEGDALEVLESMARQLGAMISRVKLYEAVNEQREALQDLVSSLFLAQEEDRRRVAYDIHDGLAQTAAATFQQLQLLAESEPGSPQAKGYLDAALSAAQRTVTEARQVIAHLRPTILDDFGLSSAIEHEIEALRSEGRDVTFEGRTKGVRLPDEIETALYRVAQEALTNVRKHAGPSRVRVTLDRRAEAVRLEVRDWGRGLRAAGSARSVPRVGVGLAGMRERLSLVGGTLSVTDAPDGGVCVLAVVPWGRRRSDRGNSLGRAEDRSTR